jgi:hypothetical protein
MASVAASLIVGQHSDCYHAVAMPVLFTTAPHYYSIFYYPLLEPMVMNRLAARRWRMRGLKQAFGKYPTATCPHSVSLKAGSVADSAMICRLYGPLVPA